MVKRAGKPAPPPAGPPPRHPRRNPRRNPNAAPGAPPARPASQATARPGAQPGEQPGTQPGSQPGTQPGAIPPAPPPELDDLLIHSIISYVGGFEEHSLMRIASRCARMAINYHFLELCGDSFQMPTFEAMRESALEEMKQEVEEQAPRIVEKHYPNLPEEIMDLYMNHICAEWEAEYAEQIKATTHAALKELGRLARSLQKEIKAIRRKYTGAVSA